VAATGHDSAAETGREVAARIGRAHRAVNGKNAAIAQRATRAIGRARTGHAASTAVTGRLVVAPGHVVVATAVRGAVRRDAAKRE
jgi:hypothetical protein